MENKAKNVLILLLIVGLIVSVLFNLKNNNDETRLDNITELIKKNRNEANEQQDILRDHIIRLQLQIDDLKKQVNQKK